VARHEQILRGVPEKRWNHAHPAAAAAVRSVGHVELVQLRTGQRTRQQDQAGPEPASRERAKDAVA